MNKITKKIEVYRLTKQDVIDVIRNHVVDDEEENIMDYKISFSDSILFENNDSLGKVTHDITPFLIIEKEIE